MVTRARNAAGRGLAGLLSLLLVAGVLGLLLPGTARADSAPLNPADPATPPTVTADPLPTVQIDGVAWSQVVVGDTVYVAGRFTRARPAGAPAGSQETVRNNLLAYDIRTGALITSFAPDLNGQVLAVTASPDGRRLYVGGDFTSANGQVRNRIAAYDIATGALVADFRPSVSGQVRAIAATNSTVWFGGSISAVGSTSRTRLAAVSAHNGALLPWAPVPGVGPTSGNRLPDDPVANSKTSNNVLAMVVTGGGNQVVVAGRFDTLNGAKATGVGALDPVSGATRPFAVNQLITNQGVNSAIYSLSTDGTTVYGTGYDYYGPGNLEGAFAAQAAGGGVRWIADCRGDTYSSHASGGALYLASHAHDCNNIGAFPEQSPQVFTFATALSLAPTGKVGPFTMRPTFGPFYGKPAPALQAWFPTFTAGTITKQYQAGWSVSGNSQYVTYAGEFPRVNGVAQAGLVRFARPGTAPSAVGPDAAGLTPEAVALGPGEARISWRESTDRDNEHLTYRVYRDGGTTPVHQITSASRWYDIGRLAYTDRGLSAGEHTYHVTVTDPAGNLRRSVATSVTVAAGTPASRAYSDLVRADGAGSYWSLGEPVGSTTAYDRAGGYDLKVNPGIRLGESGAVIRDPNTAAGTRGLDSSWLATQTPVLGPNTFSIEAWFQTRTTSGGKIVGFGRHADQLSGNYDRHIYMNRDGRLNFGAWAAQERIVTSPAAYNDGRWHHVVAALGPQGMALYVDGKLVGSRTDTTSGEPYYGYWRIGGDNTWGDGARFFSGRVDVVAVYPTVLTAGQVSSHWTAGSTGSANVRPTAAFTSSVTELAVTVDGSASSDPDGSITRWAWDFGDGTSGTGPTASHRYAAAGSYPVTLVVTDDKGAVGTRTGSVTVSEPPRNAVPQAAFGASVSGLGVAFDGSSSTDTDGTVTSWAWEFGDGASGTGVTASHTYPAAGTYTVRLTVTDDAGGTGTVTESVTVTGSEPGEQVQPLAVDAFERTVAAGFGTAETGGPWSASGGPRSVSEGMGHLQVTAAGGSSAVWLSQVSAADVAVQTDITLQAAPTGAGTYVYLVGRRTAGGHYRAVTRFLADGTVSLGLSRVVSNVETRLGTVALPGTYTPGTALQVRLDLSGTGTTELKARAWVAGTPEPADWQVRATDDTAALQGPGAVGVTAYVSGSATAVPVRVGLGSFWAGPSGTAPRLG